MGGPVLAAAIELTKILLDFRQKVQGQLPGLRAAWPETKPGSVKPKGEKRSLASGAKALVGA
ncbi:MAG: hypothetical protein KJ749_10000 [Planctomycetes bacterium]|nr:hypothetical protein [Planctomycetota bacterium]